MQPTRYSTLQEIDRELAMRRRVWRAKNGPDGYFFTDQNHNDQYARLETAKHVLTKMTDQQFNELLERHYESEAAKGSQAKMF